MHKASHTHPIEVAFDPELRDPVKDLVLIEHQCLCSRIDYELELAVSHQHLHAQTDRTRVHGDTPGRVNRAKEKLVHVIVDAEAAQTQKVQPNHCVDFCSEGLKVPQITDHHGERGYFDRPKLHLRNPTQPG